MENNLTINAMNASEARECVEKINSNLSNIGVLVLDLYEREGWKALGYKNWRECVTNEFKDKQRYLYYQLEAAKTERNLCTIVQNGKIGTIPESHLRPLTHLPPEQQREVWQKAVETAPEGRVTAKHVESVVKQTRSSAGEGGAEKSIQRIKDEDSDALFQMKRWWKRATKKDRKAFLNWIKNQ